MQTSKSCLNSCWLSRYSSCIRLVFMLNSHCKREKDNFDYCFDKWEREREIAQIIKQLNEELKPLLKRMLAKSKKVFILYSSCIHLVFILFFFAFILYPYLESILCIAQPPNQVQVASGSGAGNGAVKAKLDMSKYLQ